jgi:hypothetical protein
VITDKKKKGQSITITFKKLKLCKYFVSWSFRYYVRNERLTCKLCPSVCDLVYKKLLNMNKLYDKGLGDNHILFKGLNNCMPIYSTFIFGFG